MDDTPAAGDTGLETAFSTLGDSMDDLSSDLSTLGSAVADLEASTRSLCDQQRKVAEEMETTATSLRDGRDANTVTRTSFVAADD